MGNKPVKCKGTNKKNTYDKQIIAKNITKSSTDPKTNLLFGKIISRPDLLINGYIREIQVSLNLSIPTSIIPIFYEFYFSRNSGLYLLFLTHDNNPSMLKKPPYSYSVAKQNNCSMTIKRFNIKSNKKQIIKLFDVNNKPTSIPVDPYQSLGHCLIPNVNILPTNFISAHSKNPKFLPNLKTNNFNVTNYSLLYRFGSNVECIAFDSNNTNDVINGYLLKHKNNDPEQKEHQKHKIYYPMVYNQKRNTILSAGGAFDKWDFFGGGIAEYDINTNKTRMYNDSIGGLGFVLPSICLINDDKLVISGGRTKICMTDSLCGCTISKGVCLFDLNKSKSCSVSLTEMNIKRKGHGSININELKKIIVGGGEGYMKNMPNAMNSMEIFDIIKNKWILIKNICKYQYHFANIFCDKYNPNIVSICGFGESKYNPPHCESIDIRANQQWMTSNVNELVNSEKNWLHIVL